jgi:hypothetical protein
MQYDFCKKYNVDFHKNGKFIIGTEPESEQRLMDLQKNAALLGTPIKFCKIPKDLIDVFSLEQVMAFSREIQVLSIRWHTCAH